MLLVRTFGVFNFLSTFPSSFLNFYFYIILFYYFVILFLVFKQCKPLNWDLHPFPPCHAATLHSTMNSERILQMDGLRVQTLMVYPANPDGLRMQTLTVDPANPDGLHM